MPLIQMREIWTPIKLIGVNLFKSDNGSVVFIMVFNHQEDYV
ncbi:hypothetical protein [Peribacillus butanolivorans]